MAFAAEQPLMEGLYTLLQNAGVQAAAVGGVQTDVPANPVLPFLWVECVDETDRRGFGTGGLPEVRIRTHAFSEIGSLSEAQTLSRLAIGVLRDAPVTVAGYTQCGLVFYDDSMTLKDQILNGIKVHEVVANFRIYVEEQP